ncbi:MAG: hypothetical protein ABIR71_03480 [Chthoniobacterales bacterium]
MNAPDRGRDLGGALVCAALVLLFFLILLWRDPLLFWNDDYELSILPVFADVARSWSEGSWPLLSPFSWVCGNLAGEFQYGTFSVFVNAAVVLIWKFPLTFPQQAAALSLTHLVVLAVGGYLLGRERKLEPPLAVMVGLIAALNGWIVCWGAIDWFGALGAFAWLPWAWWGAERALDPERGRTRFVWTAPFVYLVIAGGFPYTVVMLALLLAWLAVRTITETRNLLAVLPLAVGTLLGVGLAAPAWLALLDYVSGSARAAQESASHWQWIVPPGAWPGLVLPAWTVPWADFSTRLVPHTATELAAGLVAPAALLFGFLAHGRPFVRRVRWELALLVIVLGLAMLPTASVFRWSFRWLPLLHLVLALCAAEALQMKGRAVRWSAAYLAIGLLLLAGMAMWLSGAAGKFGTRTFVALLAVALLWALVEWTRPKLWTAALITFLSLLAAYLCIPPNGGVPKYNLDQRLTSAAPLDRERLYLSVHPAPEYNYRLEEKPAPFGLVVRPGSTAMWGGVRFINGYSPVRPAGVAREFDVSIHGELAPWAGEYFPAWRGGPDDLLARLGVDGIVVAQELAVTPQPGSEWALAYASEEGRVYHRRGGPFPRIQSITADEARPGEEFARAEVQRITDTRNRVTANVAVPAGEHAALLTFSRPFFRGYQATLDGRTMPVVSWRGLVPAVEIPAGASGQLVLRYQPSWLVGGGVASLVCAGLWLVGLGMGLRRS